VDGNKLTLFKRIVANNESWHRLLSAEYDLLGRLGDYAAILTTVLVAKPRGSVADVGAPAQERHGADRRYHIGGAARDREARLRVARITKSDDEVGVLAAGVQQHAVGDRQPHEGARGLQSALQSEVEERERAQKARDRASAGSAP